MLRPATFTKFLGQHVKSRMLSGLLVILPLGATYLIIKFLFDIIDPPLRELIKDSSGQDIPGVGIIAFLVILYLAGLVGSYVIGRRVIAFGHRLADLIPIVRPIYRTARQTVDALGTANWEQRYNRVVLLDYPKDGVKSIGFVTASYKDARGDPMVAVYIPTSPVPTSGFLALLPEDKVVSTTLSVDEAMKIVISGGVLTPPQIQETSVLKDGYRDGVSGEEGASRDASNQ